MASGMKDVFSRCVSVEDPVFLCSREQTLESASDVSRDDKSEEHLVDFNR